jgi:hypothetical protein
MHEKYGDRGYDPTEASRNHFMPKPKMKKNQDAQSFIKDLMTNKLKKL